MSEIKDMSPAERAEAERKECARTAQHKWEIIKMIVGTGSEWEFAQAFRLQSDNDFVYMSRWQCWCARTEDGWRGVPVEEIRQEVAFFMERYADDEDNDKLTPQERRELLSLKMNHNVEQFARVAMNESPASGCAFCSPSDKADAVSAAMDFRRFYPRNE